MQPNCQAILFWQMAEREVAKEKFISRLLTEGVFPTGNFSACATLSPRGYGTTNASLKQIYYLEAKLTFRGHVALITVWEPRSYLCKTLSLVDRTPSLPFLTIYPMSQFLDQMYYFAVIFRLKLNNKNKLEV